MMETIYLKCNLLMDVLSDYDSNTTLRDGEPFSLETFYLDKCIDETLYDSVCGMEEWATYLKDASNESLFYNSSCQDKYGFDCSREHPSCNLIVLENFKKYWIQFKNFRIFCG